MGQIATVQEEMDNLKGGDKSEMNFQENAGLAGGLEF